MMTVGCYKDYLDDPIYNNNRPTVYAEPSKDNFFVGIPTMVGDLIGCGLTVPFLPIYFPLEEKYQDDEDAYNTLHTTYSAIPRFTGNLVAWPLRLVKYICYDMWYHP